MLAIFINLNKQKCTYYKYANILRYKLNLFNYNYNTKLYWFEYKIVVTVFLDLDCP